MAKRYHVSRHIDAPVERVWALLTDASRYRAWNRAVVSIEGPITEGAAISLVSIVNPKRTFKLKVTEMSPPNRMVWGDGMPLGLFKGERTYRLEEVAGGTEFSMTEVLSGPLSGLITRTIPDMTDSFNQFADGLKTAANRIQVAPTMPTAAATMPRNDATMFEAVLDDIPAIRMPTGRRRRRPTKVHGDKAYDHRRCRAYLRRRGIRPRIARRRIEPSDRLGRHRWTIERTGAWLGGWRRLRIRYERCSERFYALMLLACSVICFNALQRPPW